MMDNEDAVHSVTETTESLRELAATYASGVDTRSSELLLTAFHPDAVVEVHSPAFEPSATGSLFSGHAEIGRIATLIGRYRATFHLLGQSRFQIDHDEARGEVYCVAHHYTPTRDGHEDMIMYIRYEDEYRRDERGRWKITHREVRPSWTETHLIQRNPSEGFEL
jgi:SnoaL-like domain